MITEKLQNAINAQITREIWSANLYLLMAFYLDKEGFGGFATWMKKQSQEEMEHAYTMADYVIKRGGTASFGQIDAVPTTWTTPLNVFDLFFCFFHLWAHIISENNPIPRSFVDLAVMTRHYGNKIDTALWATWLQRWQLTKAWQKIGCFLAKHLGLQPKEIPLYSTRYETYTRIETLMNQLCFDPIDHKAQEAQAGLVRGRLMALQRKVKSFRNMWLLHPSLLTLKAITRQLNNGLKGFRARL